MAIRTTSDAVAAILAGHYDGETDLTAFIEAASSIADDVAACASSEGTSLSDVKLELIERWLSGHFYAQADPFYKSKSTGKASATFTDTDYSKIAEQLDSSGCLADILAGGPARIDWLGKPPSSQIDYVDRD